MRRETQNLLLLLLGGALLKLALSGEHVRYVKAAQLPWLLGAGAVMVLLSLVAIARDVRGDAVVESADHEHEGGSRSPWLMLLPVFAIFLIAPPALGADSVRRERSAAPPAPEESRFPPLPPGPAPELSMSEYVTRAAWGGDRELAQRSVRLRGFAVHPEPGSTQLARMRISCCAADATAVRVDLTGRAAQQVATAPADAWFEITATARPGSAGEHNGYVPAVRVTAVRPIAEPTDTYEY